MEYNSITTKPVEHTSTSVYLNEYSEISITVGDDMTLLHF